MFQGPCGLTKHGRPIIYDDGTRVGAIDMVTARQQPIGMMNAEDPEVAAFSQLFGTMAANPAVERIAIDHLGRYIDLWVRLTCDDDAYSNEFALYDALTAYHRSEGVTTPADIHLILPDESDDQFPSSYPLLYRRRP